MTLYALIALPGLIALLLLIYAVRSVGAAARLAASCMAARSGRGVDWHRRPGGGIQPA
jgi:hypothetical protein